MIALYIFRALVCHIYKNSGLNDTPKRKKKCQNLLYDVIMTCNDMQIFDVLSDITFHQIVVATCLYLSLES